MSKVVLVAGTGRSGTSAVAGVLHNLGVHMGDKFVDATTANKYGTFEEFEYFTFNRSLTVNDNVDAWLDDYIARRSDGHEYWGIKDPLLTKTFPQVVAHLDDVKVIIARRGEVASVNSYLYAYHSKVHAARDWYAMWEKILEESLANYQGEVLFVDYDDLVENPSREVGRIAEYVYGAKFVSGYNNAVAHVRTDGRHFDRDGKWIRRVSEQRGDWGRIAVGVRVAKFPEYHFFASWTKLLTGGMRNGDTVLMPVGWMPAHWAGNALVRDFLRTDRDSLLMIDDDMVFEQDALELLRSNPDTMEYDIVFGFCTHRNWPPRPVVMRVQEQQPGLPFSLMGQSFDYAHEEIADGAIVDVSGVGLAFTLIKRHVLESMTDEYGPMFTSYFTYGPGMESDDIPFSRRARELGYRMAVDTNVKIGHIGQTVFGWADYVQWKNSLRAANVVEFDATELAPILREAMPHLEKNKVAAQNVLKWIGENDG